MNSVKIDECSKGDVCWILAKNVIKPIFGTIVNIYKGEEAITILSTQHGYITASCSKSFWNEKDAKAHKRSKK